MNIVLVSDSLLTGGAETFVLRLASALAVRLHNVSIFVLRPDLIDTAMANQLAPGLVVSAPSVRALRSVLRVDGLLFCVGVNFSLLRWLQVRAFRRHLQAVRADIAHSHLFPADLVTARACVKAGVNWITTMHGDYISLEKRAESRAARILDFRQALREVERSARHFVAISENQHSQLRRLLAAPARDRISKVYNGYAEPLAPKALPEQMARIPQGDFVIGMVSRGIQEKGWDVLLAAFDRLQLPNAWLVLVGDGDYIRSMKELERNARVVFVGNVVDPLRYIARFDVACLPTRCPTESLPTVIIEYLVAGKPVIATDIGEVPLMLATDGAGSAGILVPFDTVDVMTKCVADGLAWLYADRAERGRLRRAARQAAAKFDMGRCVDRYVDLYTEATV